MNIYNYHCEELSEMCNHAYDLILLTAQNEGVLSDELLEKLTAYRTIVTDKPNLFSRMCKWLTNDDTKLRTKTVKVCKPF